MAERYEYYITGDDYNRNVYGDYWSGQSFTPSVAHKITSVKLKLRKHASTPAGTLTVSIRETSEGLPTGGDLCSGTMSNVGITTGAGGAWYEITLGAGAILAADTQYVILVRDSNVSGYCVQHRWDSTSPTYADGTAVFSNDGGSSFFKDANYDAMFEEWGEAIAPPVVGRSFGYIMG